MSALLRLYPPEWRARYQDEFLALLSEQPPDVRDRVDIVRGAIDARLHPQVTSGSPGPTDDDPARARVSSPIIGWLTLAGGVAWLVALLVFLGSPWVEDEGGRYRDGSGAVPFVSAALILLGVGWVGVLRDLPRGSDVAAMSGAGAIVAGVIWSMMPWVLLLLALASIGYVVVAHGAWRAGRWSAFDVGLLVAGLAIAWLALAIALLGRTIPSDGGAILVFWLAMTSVWVAVGHSLVTGRSVAPVQGSTQDA